MFIALIPAFNEEQNIARVVRSLLPLVDRVVVIDDGSTDGTAVQARESGATVLSHPLNRGQGAALETGHEYARQVSADFVLHFDADQQFSPEDVLPALTQLQKSGVDILLGSRFLDKRTHMPWQKRWFIHPLVRFFHTRALKLKLTDVHNGFRILSPKALHSIRLTQDRMAHATEILHLIQKHQLSYQEFPVVVTYHRYGQSAKGGLSILKDLFTGIFLR